MRLQDLKKIEITGTDTIHEVLDALEARPLPAWRPERSFREAVAGGVAFATFAYDIDGVSIEIAKYARAMEELLGEDIRLHCIGGNFSDKADVVLEEHWKRHLVPNTDGWSKWDDGRWFSKMFYEDMPDGSETSRRVAHEMWDQALAAAERLTRILDTEDIGLLVVVNVNSNPGNFAYALATVLASEITGCPVICNNHDFYWEGGRPPEERTPDEPPGPRDHFFRNKHNRWFFEDFRRVLPWSGRRWVQVNINHLQSQRLVSEFGMAREDVFEIGTALPAEFFEPCSPQEKRRHRFRLAHILSGGSPVIETIALDRFLAGIGTWLHHQRPVVVGNRQGLKLDLTKEALWMLQPTRVVERKRIERDWDLLGALLRVPTFREYLHNPPRVTLTLHVTGPVPIEHQADLERVLLSFQSALDECPSVADRVFMAFSVGTEDHPSLHANGLGGLHISDIYKLSDVVLFPSQVEGRGLPIPECAAAGIPMFCSRYEPDEVFASVVGEDLDPEDRIDVDIIPEGEIKDETVRRLVNVALEPRAQAQRAEHNRAAARRRFSQAELARQIERFIGRLDELCNPNSGVSDAHRLRRGHPPAWRDSDMGV